MENLSLNKQYWIWFAAFMALLYSGLMFITVVCLEVAKYSDYLFLMIIPMSFLLAMALIYPINKMSNVLKKEKLKRLKTHLTDEKAAQKTTI